MKGPYGIPRKSIQNIGFIRPPPKEFCDLKKKIKDPLEVEMDRAEGCGEMRLKKLAQGPVRTTLRSLTSPGMFWEPLLVLF